MRVPYSTRVNREDASPHRSENARSSLSFHSMPVGVVLLDPLSARLESARLSPLPSVCSLVHAEKRRIKKTRHLKVLLDRVEHCAC